MSRSPAGPLAALLVSLAPALAAQDAGAAARQLGPSQTGCDTTRSASADSVYDFDAVDQQVEAARLDIDEMPFRTREVLTGRSVLRFIVESSGAINRCSIVLVEEDNPAWTDAVVKELRKARYQAARKEGRKVRQRVHQIFTYHQDGRFLHGR